MMKFFKILFISIVTIILIVFIGIIIFISSTPKLSTEAESIFQEVVKSEVPELVKGDTGFALNDSISIWHESMQPKDSAKAAILLFMGISNDALAWPDYFLQPMIDSGYQVIRFDYRGTGLSDWMEDWNKSNAYTLTDIANDGIAILDKLQIDKAHIIGLSMGGMVAQEMIIKYPERALSLTSIMSSGYIQDPELPGISMDIVKGFIKLGIRYGIIKSEVKSLKLHVSARHLLMGEYQYNLNYKKISEQVLYNIRNRNGFNPRVSEQHSYATSLSGSRYDELKNIQAPTLVIHGKSDPFVPIEHSKKYAKLIPNAKTFWVDGLGHDIPEEFSGKILYEIFNFYQSIEK